MMGVSIDPLVTRRNWLQTSSAAALAGVPSQDMFDMQPKAPAQIRGEFHPIATIRSGRFKRRESCDYVVTA